jgi:sugar-specific transcriptional regulator TrmB
LGGERPGESGDEELVSLLQRSFRLTRYEAKLYLALLRGASNPREASSMSGVPLPRIYDVVRVLESKGFVVPSEGWYRPLPPRAVAVAEIARVEGEARSRVKQILEVAEALERLVSAARDDVEIAILDGLYSILSSAAEELRKAGRLMVVVSSALRGAEETLAPLIRDAVSRGIKVVVAVVGDANLKTLEDVHQDIRVVRIKWWLPDMIIVGPKVIFVVPDRRSGGVKGFSVRDPAYSSEIASALTEALGL